MINRRAVCMGKPLVRFCEGLGGNWATGSCLAYSTSGLLLFQALKANFVYCRISGLIYRFSFCFTIYKEDSVRRKCLVT